MISSAFQQVLGLGSARRRAATLLTALAASVVGCSAGAGPNQIDENVDHAIQPIIRGIGSGTEHDAVVVLTTFREGLRRSLCTATLVAPNLILTARHCVSDTESSTACAMDGTPIVGGGVKADRNAGDLVVFVGKGGVAPDTEVENNGVARGAKVIVDAATNVCNRDVAFVVLDRKLTAPVAPIRLGPPAMSETVSAVGWGIDESGTLPESREVRADIALIGVGPAMYPDHATYGYGDSEFMIGESACAGDSGSPAFVKSGAVVGVAARAGNGKARDPNNFASTCVGETAHAVYTHLASMHDLVGRAFQESGEEMWLEGQPDPRAAKPKAIPDEVPSSPPPATTAAGELATPPDDDGAPAAAAGCSLSSEPQSGAVEYAAGFVALLASLVGLRRRFGRRGEPELAHEAHRDRLPSLP